MFEARSSELELLDAPDCPMSLALESYRFMEGVNRFFGGVSSVWRFVEEEASRLGAERPLRVLDIGSGCCDIPLAVCRKAAAKGLKMEISCLEPGASAFEIARGRLEASGWSPPLKLLKEDVFLHEPAVPYDCAVSSMCFHHFDDERILALLRRLSSRVRGRVLVNDLERSPLSWLGAALLTAFSSSGVKRDAKLSTLRGFSVPELKSLLSSLDGVSVEVSKAWLCRVRAVVAFERREAPL